jgi:hypothetical protein
VTTYKVGGEGGWDYLIADPDAHRVYISRGTHVLVLDPDSGKNLADIPDTPGVHGIALAPELGRGFTSNGREGTVSIFDIKTLALISKVKVGENPDEARLHLQREKPGLNGNRRCQRKSPRYDQARWQAGVCRQRCQGRGLRQHRGQKRADRDRSQQAGSEGDMATCTLHGAKWTSDRSQAPPPLRRL